MDCVACARIPATDDCIRRQHRHLRPQHLPPRRLLRIIRCRKIRARIGPHDQAGGIVESIGRIDVVAIARAADADLRIPRQKPIDAFGRAAQRRVGQAVLFADTRDGPAPGCAPRPWRRACERAVQPADHGVLGRPGRIGIEIEHVVIVDAVIDIAPGQHVPHRLHQASRHDPRIRQRQPNSFSAMISLAGLRSARLRNSSWVMTMP